MNATQKKNRVARALRHAEQDLLISGAYIRLNGNPKGCSVGCDAIDIQVADGVGLDDLSDTRCHALVAEHDGTPEWLERLRDTIFEGLEEEHRSWWHVELAKSLPETDDWQPYFHAICKRVLQRCLLNKACWQDPYAEAVESSLVLVIDYHDDPSVERRSAARSAAESAARSAARSAAWSSEPAARSARSAARSAACSSESAVWSAARSAESAVWSAARSAESAAWSSESAEYKAIAGEVIQVFSEVSV